MMPRKLDFFSCIQLFNGFASKYDWMNHCLGAHALMQEKDAPLYNTGQPCSDIRHPDSIGYRLDLLKSESDDQYEAYDEDNVSITLKLTWREVDTWALDTQKFAGWVQRILGISGRIKPRILNESGLIMWPVGNDEVYLYMRDSYRELRDILQSALPQKAVTLLLLADGWWQSTDVYELVCRYPLVCSFSLCDLIQYVDGKYCYSCETPFAQVIKHHEESRPDAEFMPRPAGCSWLNLCLQIRTTSHNEDIMIANDTIIAWYEDSDGKQLSSRIEKRIGQMKPLCRNNKATLIGRMLKNYARLGGREILAAKANRNQLHGIRKKLREFLCCQFGFSLEDFPIKEELRDVYRTEFSISFADSNSDPLSPNRKACRQRLD